MAASTAVRTFEYGGENVPPAAYRKPKRYMCASSGFSHRSTAGIVSCCATLHPIPVPLDDSHRQLRGQYPLTACRRPNSPHCTRTPENTRIAFLLKWLWSNSSWQLL